MKTRSYCYQLSSKFCQFSPSTCKSFKFMIFYLKNLKILLTVGLFCHGSHFEIFLSCLNFNHFLLIILVK